MTTKRKATPVLVRALGGIALNRWVVDELARVGVITNDDGAWAIENGRTPNHELGFPKEDIFCPPTVPVEEGSTPDWSILDLYFCCPLQVGGRSTHADQLETNVGEM